MDMNEMKAKIAAARAVNSCLSQFPVVMAIIAAAHALKNETVRTQVLEILRCGLENADDTASERTYNAECARFEDFKRDYPTRAAYWLGMFYSSTQSMSCEARYLFGADKLDGRVSNWLQRRGLRG